MIRSGLSLMIGMVLGRFLGLLREVILFRQFGTTLESDILIALITLPDILISLFVGNAMPVVFLKRIQLSGPRQKLRFLLKLSLYFFAGFILISFVLFVFPAPLAKTIFPMHHNSQVFLEGLRWVIWTIPILCLNSITRVFLQSEGKLFLVGLENVIFNLAIIAGILMLHGKLDVKIVSIALLAGALLRWLTQLLQIVFILRRNPEQKAEKKK